MPSKELVDSWSDLEYTTITKEGVENTRGFYTNVQG